MAVMELKYGYTLADLHAIARLAVHTAGPAATDWRDRYETAWSAIAEHLYTAPHWPTRHALTQAGQLAIYRAVDEHQQAYGYYRRKTDGIQHGVASSPAYRTYWWDVCGALPVPSPEGRIVERAALGQILPMLTAGQREALAALAVCGTYQDAAAMLGKSYGAFTSLIATGRRRFLRLWHEGEAPSRPWGCDRRADRGDNHRSASRTLTLRRRAAADRRRGAS